jgi:hypothetical protein
MRGLLIHSPFRARAAPWMTLIVSAALFASENKEPDAGFKSKPSFEISSSKSWLQFEDKGFNPRSQGGNAKLLHEVKAIDRITCSNEKNRSFPECFHDSTVGEE